MHMRLIPGIALLIAAQVGAAQEPQPPQSPQQFPVERIAAIAGAEVVLATEVEERLAQYAQELASRGQRMPTDSASLRQFRLQMLDRMINDALMVQRAKQLGIEVTDEEVEGVVGRRMQAIQGNFPSETAFREELRRVGFGSPEEFRRRLQEQERRNVLQQRLISQLREEGKLAPVPVTDAAIAEYFEENKDQLPRIPSTVAFRQVIVAPRASEAARAASRAKAESLLVEIRGGADFAAVARRESDDPGTREQGGDLGWSRRSTFVPEFENMMVAMPVGRPSPVFETAYGFHILRVDRVQAGEYKVRHILLSPDIDSADVARARAQADSVAERWRAGVPFDTLAARYHDATEDRAIPEFLRDSLPPSYRQAFEGKTVGDITDPFPVDDPRREAPKYVVAQITSEVEAHEATLADMKDIIRQQLSQERAIMRLIASLRQQMYVRVML
ncbi:MAG TPA: peptidylprolyl isomerase [Burkholderiales bacterium]